MTISKVRKSNRLTLLFLQKRIEEEVCAACPFYNIPTQKHCEGCQSFEELNNIGNWLLNDTAIGRGREVEVIETKSDRVPMTPYMMSINEYYNFKYKGLRDPEIAAKLNVTMTSFRKWKEDAGLTNVKGR